MFEASRGDRIEQLVLALVHSQTIVLETLASGSTPDLARLRLANNNIVDLIQRLYSTPRGTIQ